jgi:hypothetical protein
MEFLLHPVAIIGGTFLLWIAARKRLSDYAALMQRNGGPSPVAGGGISSDTAPIAINAADGLEKILDTVWQGLKA